MMEIVIKIPKEFEEHFNSDRFEDSLQRCRCDIKRLLLNKNKFSLSGKYEIELLDMLTDAFEKGTPLPEHHGRLIDADAFIAMLEDASKRQKYNELLIDDCLTVDDVFKAVIESLLNEGLAENDTPTIIEADREASHDT